MLTEEQFSVCEILQKTLDNYMENVGAFFWKTSLYMNIAVSSIQPEKQCYHWWIVTCNLIILNCNIILKANTFED